LADLVPPPRKHRHRYHGVFAPNHKLRRAGKGPVRIAGREHTVDEPLILRAMVAEVPLAGLFFARGCRSRYPDPLGPIRRRDLRRG